MSTAKKLVVTAGLIGLAVGSLTVVLYAIDCYAPVSILVGRTGSDWTPAKIAASEAIGDRIVVALDQYHADHGTYPTGLTALAPRYLPVVPTPSAGTGNWEYGALRADEFDLAFYDRTGNSRSSIDSASRVWDRQSLSDF